jgi:hypothetical protein
MSMRAVRRMGSVWAVALAVTALAGAARAGVPQSLSHQGRLYDAADKPVSGMLSLTFAVYADVAATTPLWTETDLVTFDEGYFSVSLGATTPFPADLFDGSVRALGITVGADPEMTPRVAVQSVPYAFVAGDVKGDIHPSSVVVNGATVIDGSGNWTGPMGGLQGPVGPMGPAGPTGPAGATGAPGATGAMGPVGPQGPVGATGPVGPTGPAGNPGAVGPTGAQGPSGIVGSGQVSWANGPSIAAGAWVNLPQSTINFTSLGGPLMITVDIYLINGSHATCRPVIDGQWAGTYGGLVNSGDPFWQEGLTYSAGNVWHPWNKTRMYPGVPAGPHQLQVQCATDSGTLLVCGAASVACSVSYFELKP